MSIAVFVASHLDCAERVGHLRCMLESILRNTLPPTVVHVSVSGLEPDVPAGAAVVVHRHPTQLAQLQHYRYLFRTALPTDYVLFVDDDDALSPHYIRAVFEAMQTYAHQPECLPVARGNDIDADPDAVWDSDDLDALLASLPARGVDFIRRLRGALVAWDYAKDTLAELDPEHDCHFWQAMPYGTRLFFREGRSHLRVPTGDRDRAFYFFRHKWTGKRLVYMQPPPDRAANQAYMANILVK